MCPKLPVDGVSIILGNNLAGANVFPCPVVANRPNACLQPDLSVQIPSVFPACVVTRSQLKKFDVIDISDSFLGTGFEPGKDHLVVEAEVKSSLEHLAAEGVHLWVGRDQLSLARKSDHTLQNCSEMAISDLNTTYYWDKGVLMRNGSLHILTRQTGR